MPQSPKLARRATERGIALAVAAWLLYTRHRDLFGFVGRLQMVRSRSLPQCELTPGYDRAAILERLGRVLDPELDEPLLDLGFIRALQVRDGRAVVSLQLPTSWCAINFAYMMAEDVRRALLCVEGIDEVSVRLGDHCAAADIEAAVNAGKPFAEAFLGEAGDSLEALRRTFLRKGFLSRQAGLLRELQAAGCPSAAICALRLDEVTMKAATFVIRQPGLPPVRGGSAETLRRYLERRVELSLDLSPAARLIIDPDGEPLPVERVEAYYRDARTVRVSLEANGSFCRAVLAATTQPQEG
jgi:metal-sulfur cluster biosynthetic enzyme